MSNSNIAQSAFSSATFTIAELLAMPTATNGEQFAVSQRKIDKLYDLLMKDGTVLQQPLEVTLWGCTLYLTGGRHRLAALAMAYDKATTVIVLQFTASSAEEVAERIISSNGTRSCTTTEQKFLRTSAKHGFGTVNRASIMSLLFGPDGSPLGAITASTAKAKVTTLIAVALSARFPDTLKANTSEMLAKSIVSRVSTMKRTIETEREVAATYDKEGNEVLEGVVTVIRTVSNLLAESLTSSDRMDALVDAVVSVATCSANGLLAPVGIVDKAQQHKDGNACITDAAIVTTDDGTFYNVSFGFGDNITRCASTYAALASQAIRDELVFTLECLDDEADTDTEYDELD